MNAAEDNLFNPDEGLPTPAITERGPAGDDAALADELTLDRHQILVEGDDGLPARKVATHSRDKAHYAHYYADIIGTGMRRAYGGPLGWVEPFAGPGRLFVVEEGRCRPGSPVEAVDIRHPFDHYVFADLDQTCVEALRARVGRRENVHVLKGNANAGALLDQIASLVPRNALLVLYADPEGLDLDFATVRYFAERYKHLDLLLNFPVAGVIRALSAGYEEKAGRVLGHASPSDLIATAPRRRGASIREWYERQLRGLGYDQFATEVIRSHRRNSPLYDLLLASRVERAVEFFREATKRGPAGQYTFDV